MDNSMKYALDWSDGRSFGMWLFIDQYIVVHGIEPLTDLYVNYGWHILHFNYMWNVIMEVSNSPVAMS